MLSYTNSNQDQYGIKYIFIYFDCAYFAEDHPMSQIPKINIGSLQILKWLHIHVTAVRIKPCTLELHKMKQ